MPTVSDSEHYDINSVELPLTNNVNPQCMPNCCWAYHLAVRTYKGQYYTNQEDRNVASAMKLDVKRGLDKLATYLLNRA